MTTHDTTSCEQVQERLAEHGTHALAEDPAARAHVDGCEECRAVLFALQELDAALATLPPLAPSPEVLAEIGARVAAEAPVAVLGPPPVAPVEVGAPSAPAGRRGRPRGTGLTERLRRLLDGGGARAWVFALATLVVAGLAGVLATFNLTTGDEAMAPPAANQAAQGTASAGGELAAALVDEEETREESTERGDYWRRQQDDGRDRERGNAGYRGERHPGYDQSVAATDPEPRPANAAGGRLGAGPRAIEGEPQRTSGLTVGTTSSTTEARSAPLDVLLPEAPPEEPVAGDAGWATVTPAQETWVEDTIQQDASRLIGSLRSPEPEVSPQPAPVSSLATPTPPPERGSTSTRAPGPGRYPAPAGQPTDEPALLTEAEGELDSVNLYGGLALDGDLETDDRRSQHDAFDQGLSAVAADLPAARQLLAARERTEGLTFVEPAGYWANTYVPGDPVLRDLQRRLGGTPGAAAPETALALAERARTYDQPFDLPGDSAIAVYLSSDRVAAQGESRALVQVGIQGSRRETGRRPAMNLSVVLDLSEGADTDDRASIDALLAALSEAHEVGDRFSLVVAGQPGGALIAPGRFGYGEVLVAREALWGEGDAPATGGGTLALDEAFGVAAELVAASDDPDAVLGSSLVLLVTPSTLGEDADDLGSLAHRAALAGVPTSVIGVGDDVSLAELDGIALAGQGTRRLLRTEEDAARVASEELAAASRVVARAVRLRIRLAPGVRLVDVLGSYRLDAGSAERVREAENAVDRRLARSLGIAADRGEDEDGIQIVIPAFYAEDTHVILLDVVAEGPGPVAEVSVRYKDLVHLRNGVTRASLDLARGDDAPGPLQRNVLKNLLAFELSRALADAGTLLWSGDGAAAATRLRGFVAVVQGLRAEVPGFDADPEILADLELLAGYLAALEGPGAAVAPTTLADSLLYASRRKLITPNELGGNP